jgi:hypothetical protein
MSKQSLENDLKRYLKEVRSLFPVYSVREKRFIAGFMSDVNEYAELNPDSDYEELISIFGEPKTVVSGYIADADTAYLMKRIRTAAVIKLCAVIFIALAFIAVAIFGVRSYMSFIKGQEHYIDREVIEIIEEE